MTKIAQTEPIKLVMVPAGWGVPFATAAPFPLKLETWLRMAGLRYEVAYAPPQEGPKQKTPWIVENGEAIGDSELVIEHLKKKYGVDPDAGLSDVDRALSTAWHRTFEEHYHQAFEHQLFLGRGGDARLDEVFARVPDAVRPAAKKGYVEALTAQLHARGISRHGEEILLAMGKADLDAAGAFLGDKKFFLGDQPRTVDACVFGFLGASIWVTGDNPLFRHAASIGNLRAYAERMRARFFPETL